MYIRTYIHIYHILYIIYIVNIIYRVLPRNFKKNNASKQFSTGML